MEQNGTSRPDLLCKKVEEYGSSWEDGRAVAGAAREFHKLHLQAGGPQVFVMDIIISRARVCSM